ncbi:hypothetical protein fugu_003210 [Takifugu bimaculatus]|uniref:Interleukin-1 receptor accessory protein-like 1 n=1 Tax=Takifugu bimaculatus TaxID=433685 RepID=A0A4Z2BEU9_9TELE|nr:hypothetical protein fugu_003210 [Takifugu bimaculatus]
MVALHCPLNTTTIWIYYAAQAKDLSAMSMAEQRQMGVVVHGRNLVILSASVGHQGNYSCSAGNKSGQSWFRLTIEATRSSTFDQTCNAKESCTLKCPEKNAPAENIPGIKPSGITWHKAGYFRRVEEKDHGVYTCTRHYQCHDQLYNMTFTMLLDVKPNKKYREYQKSDIISPGMDETFYVDLGSRVVINCKAVMYSEFDDLFWLIGEDFVTTNQSLPVFYNPTSESKSGEINMTASLVFSNVSEADLLRNYTCKLDTASPPGTFVTIRLEKNGSSPPSYLSLAVSVGCVVFFMISVVIVYAKFKIYMVLFLRDTLGCHRSSSDGKSYDAFLMCYKSDTDGGLNEQDKCFLESVLEERFGYSLCLYDRDVLPGNAAPDAVLDSIEQSRTVVLIPTSSDSCLESGLLIAVHSALVEHRTRLVFIQTNVERGTCSGSVSEALQLLAEAGDRVTWKGSSSVPLSSSFWKSLLTVLDLRKDITHERYRAVEAEIFMMPCLGPEKTDEGVTWSRTSKDGKHLSFECGMNFVAETQHSGQYTCLTCDRNWSFHLQVLERKSLGCYQPEDGAQYLLVNQGGNISCPGLSCSDNTDVIWYKMKQKGIRAVSSQRRGSCEHSGWLKLCQVSTYDTGVYFCDRQTTDNWIFRRAVNVTVVPYYTPREPPKIMYPDGNLTEEVELGEPHTLECRIHFPIDIMRTHPPEVQWYMNHNMGKNPRVLMDSQQLANNIFKVVKVTQRAVIEEVTPQHLHNTYTCTATNINGSSTVTIRLKQRHKGGVVPRQPGLFPLSLNAMPV